MLNLDRAQDVMLNQEGREHRALSEPRTLALRDKHWVFVLAAGLSAGIYLSGAAVRLHYISRSSPFLVVILFLGIFGVLGGWILIAQRLAARRHIAPRDVMDQASLPFGAFLILPLASLEFLVLAPSPARTLATLALVLLGFALQWVLLFSARAGAALAFIEKRAGLLLLAMALAYGLATTSLAVLSYRNFSQLDFSPDSAYFNQIFWNTAEGRFFQGSLWQERYYRPPARNNFALHNTPVFILLAPLYAAYPSYGMLMALKNAAIVLCSLSLFLLARRRADATSGLIIACAFLLYPTVLYKSLGAFHEILFAGFPLLLAFYFLDAERFTPFIVCCVFALGAREDVALTTALFGLYAWLRRLDWKWIITPLALSLIWYLFSVKILMPYVSPSSGQRVVALFAPFGASYGEILQNLVMHPGRTLSALFTARNIEYMFHLVEPVGPLGLANPTNLFLVPTLLINMLVSQASPPCAQVIYHYSFLLAGLLFVGLIFNLSKLQRLSTWFAVEVVRFRPALLCVTFLLLLLAVKDMAVYGSVGKIFNSRQRSLAEQAVRLIPPQASVAAPAKLLTQLSQREHLYSIEWVADYPVSTFDYVIIDLDSHAYEVTTGGYQRFVEQVRKEGQYRLLLSGDGLEVYRRLF